MPIQNAFKPENPPFPADFLAWAHGLRHKRFRLLNSGTAYTFEFDSCQRQSHLPKYPVAYTFTFLSADIVNSPDWRRLVAYNIRAVRFACRRQLRPEPDIERKKPRYPWA